MPEIFRMKERPNPDIRDAIMNKIVKDTTKASSFKKKITIFGSTDKKDFLSHNYVNLKAKKQFFKITNLEPDNLEAISKFINPKFSPIS